MGACWSSPAVSSCHCSAALSPEPTCVAPCLNCCPGHLNVLALQVAAGASGGGGAAASPPQPVQPASTMPQASNGTRKGGAGLLSEEAASLKPAEPQIFVSPDEPGRLKAVQAICSTHAVPNPKIDAITS
jgi:hypothetical protein